MIPIPFKYTAKIDVATPLQSYLDTRYSKGESARHHDAINAFQSLRNDVASVAAANEGAREALLKYYFQTESAKDKFPVNETAVRLPFTWTDSLKSSRQISQFSWSYERASVLYNVAALESHSACTTPRDTAEGIERAAKHFCTAAGILQHIKTEHSNRLIGTMPQDLTAEGLSMMLNVQLAQAQACYYEMAQVRGMKAETLAKIAGQAADLYRAASRSMSDAALADIDTVYPWSVYLRTHAASFDSASFWQMSQKAHADADAKGDGYGVEIAWLTVAENAANAAVSVVKGSVNPLAQHLDVTNTTLLAAKVRGRRLEAEKDNTTIYCNPVPPARDLPEVPRAQLAKPLALPDWSAYGSRDVFASIVPVEVNAAMTALEEQLALQATDAKERGNKAAEAARATLAALGLPGYLDASEGSGAGVPPALWERIRKTQIAGGLAELERLFRGNTAAGEEARATLARVLQTLDDEAAGDASCRRQFGERWTAAPSDVIAAEIRGEAAKYSKVAEAAGASDALVSGKLAAHREVLTTLGQTKPALDASIPAGFGAAATASGSAADAIRAQLKEALAQLQGLHDERPKLAAAIKERFERHAAVSAFLTAINTASNTAAAAAAASGAATAAEPADISTITERLLTTHTAATKRAFEDNMAAAGSALDTIKALHARFAEVRSQDERTVGRERALQRLADGVERFEELKSNLKEGEQFYRDLKAQADRLLVTAQDMAAARGLQQRELMMNIRAAAEADERSRTDAELAGRMAAAHIGPGASGAAAAAAGAPAYPSTAAWSGAAAPESARGGAVAVAVPLPGGPGGAAGPMVPRSYNPFDAFNLESNPSSPLRDGPSGAGGFSPTPAAHGGRNPTAAPYHPYGPGSATAAAPVAAPAPYGSGGYAAGSAYGHPSYAPAAAAAAPAPGYGGHYSAAPAPAAGPAPSSQVQQLLNMGFSPADAERALAATRNDVGAAVSMLLDGSGSRV